MTTPTTLYDILYCLVICITALIALYLFLCKCSHKFNDKEIINNTVFQKCSNCGKLIQVKIQCEHTWEQINRFNEIHPMNSKRFANVFYTLKCKKCGEIKTKSVLE